MTAQMFYDGSIVCSSGSALDLQNIGKTIHHRLGSSHSYPKGLPYAIY